MMLSGLTAAVGSFCCRSPAFGFVGASLLQVVIVTSVPPSCRTYGRSVMFVSSKADDAKTNAASANRADARCFLIPLPLYLVDPTDDTDTEETKLPTPPRRLRTRHGAVTAKASDRCGVTAAEIVETLAMPLSTVSAILAARAGSG